MKGYSVTTEVSEDRTKTVKCGAEKGRATLLIFRTIFFTHSFLNQRTCVILPKV